VKRRLGDRRGRPRFEIVGNLVGSLEILQRLEVRNLGSGGALVETSLDLPLGSRLGGRLLFRGRRREVRVEVRHVTPLSAPRGERTRYLVGLELLRKFSHVDDLLVATVREEGEGSVRKKGERRRSIRIACSGDSEIEVPVWSTVEVRDISGSGVLLSSLTPLELNAIGQLRMHLGRHSFEAGIEVRREERQENSKPTYQFGASFATINEKNRRILEGFLERTNT
jgi:hypothetical protein